MPRNWKRVSVFISLVMWRVRCFPCCLFAWDRVKENGAFNPQVFAPSPAVLWCGFGELWAVACFQTKQPVHWQINKQTPPTAGLFLFCWSVLFCVHFGRLFLYLYFLYPILPRNLVALEALRAHRSTTFPPLFTFLFQCVYACACSISLRFPVSVGFCRPVSKFNSFNAILSISTPTATRRISQISALKASPARFYCFIFSG